MPEQIRCPECDATLRVPDSLVGKAVKCPKCQTTFTAELEAPEERERIVREPARSSARRQRPPQEEDEEEPLPPEEEEEDEDRPRLRKRRRGRRADAEAAVAAPAICLIVLGGLDIFLCLLNLVLRLAGIGVAAAGGPMGAGRGGNAEMIANLAGGIIGSIIGLAFAALITMGGIKMKQLQNYGLAMTASILALLPCGNCCCIGVFFGIWALIVLNRPEVKDAFS
jgi:predicted Zn finger-like uncharacterized protein